MEYRYLTRNEQATHCVQLMLAAEKDHYDATVRMAAAAKLPDGTTNMAAFEEVARNSDRLWEAANEQLSKLPDPNVPDPQLGVETSA